MDIAAEIQDFIADNTDLVVGQTIFCRSMPAGVSRAVLVLLDHYDGEADQEIPGRYFQPYQLVVRDPDSSAGLVRANELMVLLRREIPVELDTVKMINSRPRHLPLDYRRSDGDLIEWSLNFDAVFHEVS